MDVVTIKQSCNKPIEWCSDSELRGSATPHLMLSNKIIILNDSK